jgi:tetratricopeptide (TPR) repeat protein
MRAFALLIICFAICRSSAQGQGSAPFGPLNQRQTENAYRRSAKAPSGGNARGVAIDVSTDLGRGIVAELSQENKEAIKFLTKAIEQEHGNPKNLALAYRFRGLAYKHLGQREQALRDFLEVIRIDPQLDLGYYDAGVIYNRTNRYQEAVEAMTRAIALRQPNNSLAMPLSERGNAYFHLRQFEKAQADLMAAVRRDPRNADALNNAAWFRATCPDASYRNGKEAIGLASRACTIDKWKDADEIDTLAAAYAEAGNFAEAERFELKALSVLPSGEELRPKFQARLELYRAHKPFRSLERRSMTAATVSRG